MDEIYPQKLWQLYHDLDVIAYGLNDLDKDQKEELYKRMPPNLMDAENIADSMLVEFLKKKIKEIGHDEYKKLLTKETTETAKTLYAIRCFIASSGISQEEPDVIEIFTNNNSEDFFGHNLVETCDSDKPYERAMIHKFNQKKIMEKRSTKSSSKIDELPEQMLPVFKSILDDKNLNITKENAWKNLDLISKEATINDRIISRILYLMTNASVQDQMLLM